MSENPRAAIMVKQNWELWKQSMRQATLLLKATAPMEFTDPEAKERYYSHAPIIAHSMTHDISSDVNFLSQAPESLQETRLEKTGTMLAEIARFNDDVEKKLKE